MKKPLYVPVAQGKMLRCALCDHRIVNRGLAKATHAKTHEGEVHASLHPDGRQSNPQWWIGTLAQAREEKARAVISDLDAIAVAYDEFNYGLPALEMDKMVAAVVRHLAEEP